MNSNLSLAAIFAALCICLAASNPSAGADPVGVGPSFKGPLGLQLWSLRDQFAKDIPRHTR